MEKKICFKCKKEKIISDFRKRKASKDGLKTQCKECEDNRYAHKCTVCGKEFNSSHKNQLYCSRKCSNYTRRDRVACHCEICGGEFELKKSVYEKYEHHYCSDKCRYRGYSNFFSGGNNPLYSRIEMICEACGEKFTINKNRLNISTHHYCSYECQAKGYSLFFKGENHPRYGAIISIEQKLKMSKSIKGKFIGNKSPRWNQNLTQEERIKNRDTLENIKWRESVYKHYDYTCQCCSKRGGNLIAHHLEGYNWCEHKRLDINNGVTLCENCHKNFHSIYGYGNNTKKQYEEFIKNKKIKSA